MMTLTQALTLHRNGFIEEAKAIYESLWRKDQNDADVLGLLGMIEFQQGRPNEAEALWFKTITLDSPPPVYIRNLNNLVATLLETDRIQQATELLETRSIPVWTETSAPDERQFNSIFSLALSLQRLDLGRKARPLLESLSQHLVGNREALKLLAAATLDDEDPAQALKVVKLLESSDDLWTLSARLWCAREMEDHSEAELSYTKLLHFAPICISEGFNPSRKTILIINSASHIVPTHSLFTLHYNGNFPSQIAYELRDQFNFISVFDESPLSALKGLHPDIVLNNQVNGEILSGAGRERIKETVSAVAEYFGVPVINHPQKAALATRQRLAWQLKDLPGVFVPRVLRFKVVNTDIEVQVESLAKTLGFPLIVRTTTNQRGVGMSRVMNRDELRNELQLRDAQEIYAHQFVENRTQDGLFRKIRVAFVGNDIIPIRVDHNDDWMVHGRIKRKDFYRDNMHFIAIEKHILTLPNEVISAQTLHILETMRQKIPLDIFGMDLDVLPDGRVLFFEANATMNLLDNVVQKYPDIRYFEQTNDQLKQAFMHYLNEKRAM